MYTHFQSYFLTRPSSNTLGASFMTLTLTEVKAAGWFVKLPSLTVTIIMAW